MARSRNIKPGFFENEKLAECSLLARLCFIGLWTLAGRDGRLEDRPKRIKGQLFPYENHDVEPPLQELLRHGFIERYEVDGVHVIAIPKFTEHQSPHFKEKASGLPGKPEASPGLAQKGQVPAPDKPQTSPERVGASTGQAPGKPEKGRCQYQTSTRQARKSQVPAPPDIMNPSFMIPDSLNPDVLNPDSLNPERGGAHCAKNEQPEPTVQGSAPAPLAQPPSVCDDWIFAESAPDEPASEPAALPEPAPAPSVQASPPLFDDALFADDEPVVSPEEAAAVDRLLFGKSPPPVPPPPAWTKPGKAGAGDAAPKAASAPLVQAEPAFDDLLFADDTFALTPEDEAEVSQILFGEPQPQSPPPHPQPPTPPAGKKSKAAKTGDAAPKAATRAERATRIAENWTLSDKNRLWAKENRPDIDIDLEAKKFHNHFLGVGGKEARRVDWDATWRKWALNAWGKPRASTGHHYPQHSSNRNRLEPIAI